MALRQRKIASAVACALAAVLLTGVAGVGTARVERSAQRSAKTGHDHSIAKDLSSKQVRRLAGPLARARTPTAKYAADPDAAKADGYTMTITQMIPDMRYHLLNPDITDFDVTQPPILVYVRDGATGNSRRSSECSRRSRSIVRCREQRTAVSRPHATTRTEPSCSRGTRRTARTRVPTAARRSPSGTRSWSPLHVWAWYPNPDGLFNGTNRWIRPYNDEQV